MNTDDEERRQAETGNHFVFRSTRQRTFKACRTCRQQKARCHDADDPPCRRCRATGRDCIFDIFAPQGKRRLLRQGARGLSEETSNHDNSTSESGQVAPGNTGGAIAKPHSPQAEPDSRLQRWSAEPTEPEDDNGCPQTLSATENAVRPEDLNLLRLNAPLTAVHAMRPASLSIAASSPQSNGLQASSQATTSKSFRNPTVKNTQANVSYGDVVSSGLLSESKARELFHLYMAGGNVFLPLFDTTTDTFEAVRQRSAFCLSAILAVALRADSSRADSSIIAERCLAEAQTLAARTLFSSPPELEDIQGMLVLATYAERNWFAFRHALEMAEDVGLPHCLSKLIEEAQPKNTSRISAVKGKQLARMVRTALVLHNVEREVSSGTGRQPRLPPIEKRLLRRFLENKHSIVFDIRIVSTIEVTQLRARLLQEIDALENITGAVMAKFDSFQKDIDQWFKYWDGVYQDHDINVASFHRASLRLQRDYALIILSSAMISKLGKALGIQDPQVFMTDEMSRIIDITMNTSTQLLVSMSQSESYKWHLQWAPTYSALFAVFAAALAFRLSVLRSNTTNWLSLLPAISTIAYAMDPRYPAYSAILRNLSSITASKIRPIPSGEAWAVERYRESDPSDTPAGLQGYEQIGAHVNRGPAQMETPASLMPVMSQMGFIGGEEMQFSQSKADYMIDYNSFAASLAAYENGCANTLDYTSLGSPSMGPGQPGIT